MDDLNTSRSSLDFNDLMQSIAKAWQPVMDQVLKNMQTFINAAYPVYEAIRQEYRDQGAIYGDTDDGMRRWLRECAEIEHLRTKADQIAEHQQMLRDLQIKFRPNLSSD